MGNIDAVFGQGVLPPPDFKESSAVFPLRAPHDLVDVIRIGFARTAAASMQLYFQMCVSMQLYM